MTQKAIVITGISDTFEVIKYVDIEIPYVGVDEILIKNKYAAVNFVEVASRKGSYPVYTFPFTLGCEASGVVAKVGTKVTNFSVGDNVAYLARSTYAQYTLIKSNHVTIYKLEKDISEEYMKMFGSILIQGLSALTFAQEAHVVAPGQTILVWAAAGGLGQALTQIIIAKGAHVIAVASTPEKLAIAKRLGAKYLINSTTEDVDVRVHEFTDGHGVDAVYDPVGKDTYHVSLESLSRKGTLVSHGAITGRLNPTEVGLAILRGENIKIVKPGLINYVATPEEWKKYFEELKCLVETGKLNLEITRTYPLSEYVEATHALETRETTGKLTLDIPQ